MIEEKGFFDDFETDTLHLRYSSPRADYHEFADCRVKKGRLCLK